MSSSTCRACAPTILPLPADRPVRGQPVGDRRPLSAGRPCDNPAIRPGERPAAKLHLQRQFAARGGDDFIARLWAQRKIGYLLAQIRLSGAKDELVKEIVALSTRYGIVTPYTSFLVQEPQLALTQAGRHQLSQGAVAPAPTSRPGAPPAAP